jgi:hypothetical protein
MRKVTLVLALAVVASFATNAMAGGSDHGCASCHQPHMAGDPTDPDAYGVPLWGNAYTGDGIRTYDLYEGSARFQALGVTRTSDQPDGPTKLCLGCHDGGFTYLSGDQFTSQDSMKRSHPMSFVFDSALASTSGGTLYDPATTGSGLTATGTIATDMLDTQSKVQCTSCHEPHNNASHLNETHHMKFDSNAVLCKTCHNK